MGIIEEMDKIAIRDAMHEAALVGPLKGFKKDLNCSRLVKICTRLLEVMTGNREIMLEEKNKADIIRYTMIELLNGEEAPFIQIIRKTPKIGMVIGMNADVCVNVLYTYTFAYRTSVILNRINHSRYDWWMELSVEDIGKYCIRQYPDAIHLMKQYFNDEYISKNDEYVDYYSWEKTLRENEIMETIDKSKIAKCFIEDPKELMELWKELFAHMLFDYYLIPIKETFATKVFEDITRWLSYNSETYISMEKINEDLKYTPFSSQKKSFLINGIFTAWFAEIVNEICCKIKNATDYWKRNLTMEDHKLFEIESMKVFDIIDIYEICFNEEYNSRKNVDEKLQGLKHDCVEILEETVVTAEGIKDEVVGVIDDFASAVGEKIADKIKKFRNNF